MRTTNETDALDELIIATKKQRDYELALLKEQFHTTYESLKPMNIIKNAFGNITASPTVKNDLASGALGIGAGLLSKKILTGNSHNPIRKLLGTVTEVAVAGAVAKSAGGIVAVAGNMLKSFFNKNKSKNRL